MRTPPDERLAATAAEAEPLRRLRTFTGWAGTGRKLTQTGRVTLADARELVELLGTGDVIDSKIGDRVFRTKSSEELPGITTVGEWAKACRLVRVTRGRLVPVQRNAGLADRPLELWARMFEAFPRLGAALCPPGWGESLLRRHFQEGIGAVLAAMAGAAAPLPSRNSAPSPGKRSPQAMCWMTRPTSSWPPGVLSTTVTFAARSTCSSNWARSTWMTRGPRS